ncbi:hypothetical protein JVU11DRAFT_249 [Chiua virens]|nr:hypothetical protein JVU11DRAFT_249 [Chiua virens]
MSAELTESLVAERVTQLDGILQRRDGLLREMYRMIQQKHNVGVLALDQIDCGNDDDEGLKQFMDRFDLSKNPESGMIFNLSDSELSVPFPSDEVTEEVEELVAPDVDSPMSEPPASTTRTKSPVQREEDEEAEINDVVEATAEVELPVSHRSTPSPQQSPAPEEKMEEEEEEVILLPDPPTPLPILPRPPSCVASTSPHHSPVVSQSQFAT